MTAQQDGYICCGSRKGAAARGRGGRRRQAGVNGWRRCGPDGVRWWMEASARDAGAGPLAAATGQTAKPMLRNVCARHVSDERGSTHTAPRRPTAATAPGASTPAAAPARPLRGRCDAISTPTGRIDAAGPRRCVPLDAHHPAVESPSPQGHPRSGTSRCDKWQAPVLPSVVRLPAA